MPTESELRALLQGEPDGAPRLDAARVIRRARARRLPRQLAVGALSGLAAVAIVVPVALGGLGGGSPTGGSADSAVRSEAPEGASALADGAERGAEAPKADASALLACGATPPLPALDSSGLVLVLEPGATADQATGRLLNTGEQTVEGAVTSLALAAVRENAVVSAGELAASIPIALAPGAASAVIPLGAAALTPCGTASPEPGDPLVAAIAFAPADGSPSRLIPAS